MFLRYRSRYYDRTRCSRRFVDALNGSTVEGFLQQRPPRFVTTLTPLQHDTTTTNVLNDPTTIKKNLNLKTYCINGHTMKNNRNGCVGMTTLPPATAVITSGVHPHSMSTDLPQNMGGTNTAPQPVELLLMSYIGCTQATAHFVSRHIQIRTTPSSLDSSSSYELQHMIFENITTSRDIRSSIQNVPIQIPCSCLDQMNHSPNHINHLQEISGTITVYFGSISHKNRKQLHRRADTTGTTELSSASDNATMTIGDSNVYNHIHLPKNEAERRELYLRTLHKQTELRCPIANMIHKSGCRINITWKDGGSQNNQPLQPL